MPTPFDDLDKADGFCFLARQSDLVFGEFRATPIFHRPVVSVTHRGQWLTVLPSTTKPNPTFFHIAPSDCFDQRPAESRSDSYICPRYETLPPQAVSVLRKIGVLPQALRISLVEWLQGKPRRTP